MTRDKAAGTITSRDAIAALLEKYAEHMPGEVTVPSQPGSAHQLCSNSSADATLQTLRWSGLYSTWQTAHGLTLRTWWACWGGTASKDSRTGTQRCGCCDTGRSHGITYGEQRSAGACDADHAGALTRRSTTGAVTVLHGGAVDWSSTLQSTVAASTCEAEYQAAGLSHGAVASKDPH
jgi:hypothetical protein